MKPLRISVIEFDGSVKSSTTLKAIHSLSHYIPLCMMGRNLFSILKENIPCCLPKVAKFFMMEMGEILLLNSLMVPFFNTPIQAGSLNL